MPISEKAEFSRAIKKQALSLGFTLVRIGPAERAPTFSAYLDWIERSNHGEMGYLARPDRIARRRDLILILPEARSLILVGLNYYSEDRSFGATKSQSGRISRYAWGADYHDLMKALLSELEAFIGEQKAGAACRSYVDTGAILERAHAAVAGMGFIGKNSLLIAPRLGSYFFLGEIVTDLSLEYDTPQHMPDCGSCRRCLNACPTGAIIAPRVVDARRCISYLTIELKGSIPEDLRPQIGNALFGCDICQEVCPFNRFAQPTLFTEVFSARTPERQTPLLAGILQLDDASFAARFGGSPVERTGRELLVRNACVAAGNSGDPAYLPLLAELAEGASQLISEHARWAMGKLSAGKKKI